MDNVFELKSKIALYEFRIKWLEAKVLDLENQVNDNENYQKEKQNSSNLEKKQEVTTALEYLKSKEVKTKQDQISIYTLEVILKGLK
jgi:hypothetical protein